MNLRIVLLGLVFFITMPLFANSAVVFMYHRFGETRYPSTNITLEQFKYQLDYLQKNDYKVWPLSKIVNHIIDKKTIPPKTVALTIDDAYISTYTNAYPMLKSKKFPFTVFVTTNPVDNKSKFYMSWEQMREMQAGGAEFANHALTHEFLLPKNTETDEAWTKRITKEIQRAQQRLQEEFSAGTNEKPRLFSYPFGEYNMKMAELLKKLGYIGVTQTSGPIGEYSNLRALSRFPMAEAFATPDGFTSKLNTLQMPIKSVSPIEPVLSGENPPKLRIKLAEEIKNIQCYMSSGKEINVEWISPKEVEIIANTPIVPPRDRYTCTAPAGNSKWYWYSHLWIAK
ncbi:MAG: polysaccharide deacetylase family protein [Sulfurimonas sp.]|uniref:polysaccharide deacetylase family protein n=1 Tax=Sulfurimonas sp. TaxID=2022749 RepID=UPI00261B4E06|nr:polysaccharide deacetylase family protein [Sulfurimonas sp.]MCW8895824.1 polysaccharide deacetylase family protein [Sulfurimonas sp.]MCW8954894.1 polysaccharide deacetylase family protein [Sulfurimonas sp.]MCW9067821.1 polysaccharide deacetylase family protein [Sulfurimonas sp.]